jgi:hypothetical protein
MRLTLSTLLLLACLNAWPQTPADALTGKWIFEIEYRGDRMIATRAQMNVADGKVTGSVGTSEIRGQYRTPLSILSGSLATAPWKRVSLPNTRMAGSAAPPHRPMV